jgi:hypothetical protein
VTSGSFGVDGLNPVRNEAATGPTNHGLLDLPFPHATQSGGAGAPSHPVQSGGTVPSHAFKYRFEFLFSARAPV